MTYTRKTVQPPRLVNGRHMPGSFLIAVFGENLLTAADEGCYVDGIDRSIGDASGCHN